MKTRDEITTALTEDLIQLYTDRHLAKGSADREYIDFLILESISDARDIFKEIDATDEEISFLEDIQGIAENIGTVKAKVQIMEDKLQAV